MILGAAALTVTLLGTGNPRPSIERFGPAILVEAGGRKLLFDGGRGASTRLAQAGISLSSIDAVFLTHLHSDHVVGLPDLWLTGWLFGRTSPLRILGPEGTSEMAASLRKAFDFDVRTRRDRDERLPAEGAEISARDIAEGVVWEEAGVRVTAFTVDHGPVKPALGYRVDFAGHSVVLSGDTRPSENLVKHARGADVLIHEVVAPDVERRRASSNFSEEQVARIIAHHTTPEQAGEIFTRVHPKLAVYSHIVPTPACAEDLIAPTRKTYSGPLEVGDDLMTIEIGESVTVRRSPLVAPVPCGK
jgi:ribonuclease Z